MVLLPFALISAALDAALCVVEGYTGLRLVLMAIVLFVGFFLASLLLFLLYLGLVSLFVDESKSQKENSPFFRRITNWVIGLLLTLSRVRTHITGQELLPEGRWLLVSNHRSNYDPLVTAWLLRKYDLAFVSKPENLKIPVAGKFIHKCCYLPIDRQDDRSALRTILDAIDLMKRGVVSFCIYPEGTRNTAPEMLPFRNGAFKVAQKAKAPVVVAVIENSDRVRKNLPFRHTDVYLHIVEVIDAQAVQSMNTNEIGDSARIVMERALACK